MKDIYEMALDVVNPDGGATTETQDNEVQVLVDFAKSVLAEYIAATLKPDSGQSDACPTCNGLGIVKDSRGRLGDVCLDCSGSGIRR